jgi:transposase InsO family protein
LGFLDEFGPGVSVACLRENFPFLARAELANLLRRYRRIWRQRHQQPLSILHWTRPGSVWAADHKEAPRPIDGRYPYLLAVRDLASGQQLLWLPVENMTAPITTRALASLLVLYGPPLVLKMDNGPAFTSQAVLALLEAADVMLLFSPPYTPRYNGSIEAGIGSLTTRTENQAARRGYPGQWTWDDTEAARREANALAHPWGEHGPTPDEVWAQRRPITAEERTAFLATVARCRQAVEQKKLERNAVAVRSPGGVQMSLALEKVTPAEPTGAVGNAATVPSTDILAQEVVVRSPGDVETSPALAKVTPEAPTSAGGNSATLPNTEILTREIDPEKIKTAIQERVILPEQPLGDSGQPVDNAAIEVPVDSRPAVAEPGTEVGPAKELFEASPAEAELLPRYTREDEALAAPALIRHSSAEQPCWDTLASPSLVTLSRSEELSSSRDALDPETVLPVTRQLVQTISSVLVDPPEGLPWTGEERACYREAIGRALVEHDLLLFTRRRIPLPIFRKKAANIS